MVRQYKFIAFLILLMTLNCCNNIYISKSYLNNVETVFNEAHSSAIHLDGAYYIKFYESDWMIRKYYFFYKSGLVCKITSIRPRNSDTSDCAFNDTSFCGSSFMKNITLKDIDSWGVYQINNNDIQLSFNYLNLKDNPVFYYTMPYSTYKLRILNDSIIETENITTYTKSILGIFDHTTTEKNTTPIKQYHFKYIKTKPDSINNILVDKYNLYKKFPTSESRLIID